MVLQCPIENSCPNTFGLTKMDPKNHNVPWGRLAKKKTRYHQSMKKVPLPPKRKPLHLFDQPAHVDLDVTPVLWEGNANFTFQDGANRQLPVSLIWQEGPRLTWDAAKHPLGVGQVDVQMDQLHAPNTKIDSTSGTAICLQVTSPATPCNIIEFHLINTKNLPGGRFGVGDFEVSLVQTLTPSKQPTTFTHLGQIERTDKTPFQPDQPDYLQLIEAITWTMTFISGGLVTPTILRGFDHNDEVVWSKFSAPRMIKRKPIDHNWIHPSTPNLSTLVQEVLHGFDALLSLPEWKDALRKSVDFYANAHSPEAVAAASLILLQAGLEKLVYTWDESPEAQALPSVKGGLGARLERMLQWASIPLEVPAQLPELAHLASQGKLLGDSKMNGPRVVAFVRNKFSHQPTPGHPALTWQHESQAKELMARYLELLLLKLAEVKQPVSNRLVRGVRVQAGATEPLPWVSPGQA